MGSNQSWVTEFILVGFHLSAKMEKLLFWIFSLFYIFSLLANGTILGLICLDLRLQPLCFELILGVTVESVQGSPVCPECIGTSGSFKMVARHLAFLSSVTLRPPLVEEQRERCDSFPEEVKWILLLG